MTRSLLHFTLVFPIVIFLWQCISKCDSASNLSVDLYVKNLQCIILDESFVNLTKCETVRYNNTLNFFSSRFALLKPPVEDVTGRVTIINRRTNNEVLDFGFDMCEFNEKRNNRFLNIFFDILKQYTNALRPCPYTDDIIVDRLPTTLVSMPLFAVGDNRFKVLFSAYNVPRGMFQFDVSNKAPKGVSRKTKL